MSYSRFKSNQLRFPGGLILKILSLLGLAELHTNIGEDGEEMECNNLTLINLAIKFLGPMNEGKLTLFLLAIQVICSVIGLFIRYPLAKMFYDYSYDPVFLKS